MCACVYVHKSTGAPSGPPGARAAGGCEWSDTNVRNQIQVPTRLSSYRRRIKDDQTIKAFEEFCTL